MQNPMLQSLNQSKLSPIKNMMRSIGNPQMMLQQMASQNPQMKQIMDYVNANGGDPKAAFYKKAQEMGVNPEDVFEAMRNA